MKKIILAGLRKSQRGKWVLVAFAAFLCFFSVVYVSYLQKKKAYEDDLIMQLYYQSTIVNTRCEDLMYTLQDTPAEKENPSQREEVYGWCSVTGNVSSWTYLRQVLEYFNWRNANAYTIGRAEALFALMDRGYYHDGPRGYGITKKTLETNRAYYRYSKAQDISSYTIPYELNLLNFILQTFQHDTILLFTAAVSLLMVDQICHDYDSSAYKAIYSQPISRKKPTIAKVSAATAVILLAFPAALTVFSIMSLSAYGMGSSAHPYIIHTCDIVSWTWLLQWILPFSLLVILFYMTMAMPLVSWQKMISDTMLYIDSLLVLIYFLTRILGYSIPLFPWIPSLHIYPIEIAAHDFTLDLLPCTILCIAGNPVFFLLHVFTIEKRGLEGSVRS